MSTKTKTLEKNGVSKTSTASVWSRAFTSNSEWPDKVNNRLYEFERDRFLQNVFNYFIGGIFRRNLLGKAGNRYHFRHILGFSTIERNYRISFVSRQQPFKFNVHISFSDLPWLMRGLFTFTLQISNVLMKKNLVVPGNLQRKVLWLHLLDFWLHG